jgi:ribosome-binding factor A
MGGRMTQRTERVSALLREEISVLLRDDLRDPRMSGLVSITYVDVSPDLRNASAFVSVLGSDDDRASTMQALQHARPFIRRELGRRLRLRTIPDVRFVSDTSIEQAQELTDAMRRNAQDRGESM